jgi:hypothetical protein
VALVAAQTPALELHEVVALLSLVLVFWALALLVAPELPLQQAVASPLLSQLLLPQAPLVVLLMAPALVVQAPAVVPVVKEWHGLCC